MTDDTIIPFGNNRVRIPGGIENAPHASQAVFSTEPSRDGMAAIAFVTTEPTPEAIISEGREAVAALAVQMTVSDLLQFASDLNEHIARHFPRG